MSNQQTQPKDDGGPAFPPHEAWWNVEKKTFESVGHPGMSLRDWFAGQALNQWRIDADDLMKLQMRQTPDHKVVAKFCYELADAMLAERKK